MKRQDGRAWQRSRGLDGPRAGARPIEAGSEPSDGEPSSSVRPWLWSAPQHSGRMRLRMRRQWRRLGFRRQFVGLLVLAALLSTVVSTSVGYLVLRGNALAAAQARDTRDLRLAWQLLRDTGAALSVRQGEIYVGTSGPLNGDMALVSSLSALTADQASVYQVEGTQLVPIASALAAGGGGTLSGPAYQALLGNCLQVQFAAGCARGYAGELVIGSGDYLAALTPLRDATGNAIGALGVFTAVDAALAPVRQLAMSLLLLGLALTGLVLLLGIRLCGPIERRAFAAFTHGLDQLGDAAIGLESTAGTQINRSARQAEVSRQLLEDLRLLGEVAGGLERGGALLRQAADDLWAQASTPGAGAGSDDRLTSAHQAALAASQMSSAVEHATQLCYRLRARANLVIAEADVLASCGREASEHAAALRTALLRVEEALGAHASVALPGAAAAPSGAYDTQPSAAPAAPAAPGESHARSVRGGRGASPGTSGQATRVPDAGASMAAEGMHAAPEYPRARAALRGVLPGAATRGNRFVPQPRRMPPPGVLSGPAGGGPLGAAR